MLFLNTMYIFIFYHNAPLVSYDIISYKSVTGLSIHQSTLHTLYYYYTHSTYIGAANFDAFFPIVWACLPLCPRLLSTKGIPDI